MRPKTLLLTASVLSLLWSGPAGAQLLGTIDFPNSGRESAQKDFIDGVLFLHNFEYEDARLAFQRARETDSSFVMARWGEAMTHNHPLWFEQDREAAKQVLMDLHQGERGEEALNGATDRERVYIRAVEVLFGVTPETKDLAKESRDDLYMSAMRRLHEAYPDDDEATSFYALSILGTAHEGRDFATYMRAASVAQSVWARNQEHPGAAHYLIHSFDDPVHAPLGVPMALKYAQIAPSAAHAQHMTSHIFVAMGWWEQVVEANIVARRVQNHGFVEKGRAERHCGHYPYWLLYGLLQQGRFGEASEVLDACHASDDEGADRGVRWHRATMDATYQSAVGNWEDPITVTSKDPDEGLYNALFAQGYAAHHRGEITALEGALEALKGLEFGDEAYRRGGPEVVAVLVLELEALVRLATDPAGALEKLGEAVQAEEAMPYMFGPPVVVKPSRELLGEVLLSLERFEEAGAAYARQLERTPGRSASLLGLARANDQLGHSELAKEFYDELARIWTLADSDLPALEEARAGSR